MDLAFGKAEASMAPISRITDTVMEAAKEWRLYPPEASCPPIFFGSIRVTVRVF